ncbi:hypothetical protein [Acidianus manzaensis]|uniref:hypothetical protein n=1 Tax=Acidianus manzaensis TaxID=282676 RepID=UPI001C9C3F01|nr:hypothetical protein [Acidianus manzaensis]
MKKYSYESECINANIEVETLDETYALIDDGIVYIVPNYRYLKDGKEVQYPITEGTFKRSGECTSIKREKEKFDDFVRQVLAENTQEVPIQKWIMENYPKEWEELQKDPINWFLRESEQWHIGDEEVKLLTLIAIKSAFYEGLPKIGVLVLGSAGAGKSSAVKSIVNMFALKEGYGAALWVSNLTKKALSYLAFEDNGKLLKNRCLFIVETIDVEALKELSLLMTEGRLANLTAKSIDDKLGSSYGIVDYPPSVVSTAVNVNYSDDQVTQIMSRFLTIAIDLENRGDVDKIYDKIAERGDNAFTYDVVTKYLAIAWMYYTPRSVKLPQEIANKFRDVIKEYNQYAFRVFEQGLKVMKILASLLGKEQVDEEVYRLFSQKLLRYFLVSAVGLTSVELKALQSTSIEFEETKIIAQRLRVDTETAKGWLYNLARKGLVDNDRRSNRLVWKRNEFGQKVIDLVLSGYQEEKDENGDLQFAGNMAGLYGDLKGKQFSVTEFYGILGDELADKVLKWAEERGLVNHKMIDGEEYIEFL